VADLRSSSQSLGTSQPLWRFGRTSDGVSQAKGAISHTFRTKDGRDSLEDAMVLPAHLVRPCLLAPTTDSGVPTLSWPQCRSGRQRLPDPRLRA